MNDGYWMFLIAVNIIGIFGLISGRLETRKKSGKSSE